MEDSKWKDVAHKGNVALKHIVNQVVDSRTVFVTERERLESEILTEDGSMQFRWEKLL